MRMTRLQKACNLLNSISHLGQSDWRPSDNAELYAICGPQHNPRAWIGREQALKVYYRSAHKVTLDPETGVC